MNAITIEKLSDRALTLIAKSALAYRMSIEYNVAKLVTFITGAPESANWRLANSDCIAALTLRGVKQNDSTFLDPRGIGIAKDAIPASVAASSAESSLFQKMEARALFGYVFGKK